MLGEQKGPIPVFLNALMALGNMSANIACRATQRTRRYGDVRRRKPVGKTV